MASPVRRCCRSLQPLSMYMYNLKNSITNKSFVGLGRVNTLDLSNCQIETFGVGAFDAISTSVQTLKLENNFIKTLPAGLFDIMLPSYYTRINLSENGKWICDCDFLPFRADLIEHSSNFIGTVECDSPVEFKGDKVVESHFCEPTTTTEVTTEVTTDITTEFTTDITTPLPPEIPQECFQPRRSDNVTENITIRGPSQKFSIIQNQSVGVGDILLQIDAQVENRMLIWFALDDNLSTNVSEISCMMTASSSIRVTNLIVNSISTYTFCLMNSAEKTISPLDCISYSIRDDVGHKQPWINESKKGLVIGVVSGVCGLAILAGFAWARVSYKMCANRDLYFIFPNGMMKTNDRLYGTTINVNAFGSNESAPPLPPRPYSYPTKEYTYATVQ
ncbi:uncharacterized protein LOC119066498 [Bradysia coprophila]|uniref:uncharacterized protein LOC119066498 n=1 Tax=Bradysia coprophila TaxID=38358 RepID=UPI00187DC635|nr:uncharacterized protein LOC119066498 [Bradysia coprophila]